MHTYEKRQGTKRVNVSLSLLLSAHNEASQMRNMHISKKVSESDTHTGGEKRSPCMYCEDWMSSFDEQEKEAKGGNEWREWRKMMASLWQEPLMKTHIFSQRSMQTRACVYRHGRGERKSCLSFANKCTLDRYVKSYSSNFSQKTVVFHT